MVFSNVALSALTALFMVPRESDPITLHASRK